MRFFVRLLCFVAINMVFALLYIVITQSRYHYTNADTEAHLYIIPRNQHYDLLIAGASHARALSSAQNHSRLEKILSRKILNISKTAAGVLPEEMYLSYFYELGNSTTDILYVVDPFVFYSARWNEQDYFLEDEPLRPDFLALAIRRQLPWPLLANYIRSKFTPFWITGYQPDRSATRLKGLTAVDPVAVEKRMAILYPNGVDPARFGQYRPYLERIIQTAAAHRARLTFVFLPTLLGSLPGMEQTKTALADLARQYKFTVADLSTAVKDPVFFGDHDHLNTPGVALVAKSYLVKIFDNRSAGGL